MTTPSGNKIVFKGGTYTSFHVTRATDAYGAQWMTTMSDAALQPRVFGTHIWHRPSRAVAFRLLYVFPLMHGWLSVEQGKLVFLYNKPNMDGPYEFIVPGYRHTRTSPAEPVKYMSEQEIEAVRAVTYSDQLLSRLREQDSDTLM